MFPWYYFLIVYEFSYPYYKENFQERQYVVVFRLLSPERTRNRFELYRFDKQFYEANVNE